MATDQGGVCIRAPLFAAATGFSLGARLGRTLRAQLLRLDRRQGGTTASRKAGLLLDWRRDLGR